MITGAAAASLGADLRGGDREREFRAVLTAEYNPLIEAIRGLPKPVVAAVNGVAAGAGFSLAMAADLVVASDDVRSSPPSPASDRCPTPAWRAPSSARSDAMWHSRSSSASGSWARTMRTPSAS